MVRHAVHATRKVMMKDNKSSIVKKTLDEESLKEGVHENLILS